MNEADGYSVLLVDDDLAFAETTAVFLEREDDSFTVEIVTSASDGLERLSRDDFDCIVSDYDMPGQNGIEFLKSVREKAPNLPFVLFTVKGSEEIASEAISAGVTDYLQKRGGTDQYTVLANQVRNGVRRHRAEKDRKRQQKAIETSQAGISILDEDGKYIYVNQAYADIYGYNPDEMYGEHWELVYPDGETAIARDVILPTIAEDGYWSGETTGLRADGTTFVEDHTVAQTETGELICSVRDRSVEREREIELTQFRTLLGTLSDPVYVLDETGKFEYVNDAFTEMVGYDRERIIGVSPSLIKSPEVVERSEANLGRVLSSNGPDTVQFEIEIQPKQGEPILCEDHMGVLPYEGESFEGSVGILRDITERNEREAKLEMLSAAVQMAMDGIAILNEDDEYIYMNQAHADVFGYDADELLGTTWQQLYDDDEVARLEQDVFPVLEREGEWRGETVGRLRDGSHAYQEIGLSLLDDGKLICTNRDITERKQHEHELERSNQFLEQTQTVANVGGWELDLRTESLRWTDEVYRIHGLDMDFEPTVANGIEFYHPEDRTTIRDAVERVTTEGEPYDLELRIVTADDEVRWVHARGEPRYEDGEIVGVRGTFRDITERIEREAQLEQKTEELEQLATKYENQYRTLFEEAPVMTVLTRFEDGRPIIEDCNSQFIDSLGYDADRIIGSELTEFYTAESTDRLQSGGYSRVLTGQVTRERRKLLTVDGEIVEAQLRAVPRRTADGEIIGTVAMYIDITERESVKRANKRLEEFTGVVSHDLRNPLGVATGRLELVAEECDSDHLDSIQRALDRMGALIEDLLTLAREGKEVTDTQPVDLATISNSCWETVETTQAVLRSTTDQVVRADAGRLRQVFENLFRNAVEHGGMDVTVTVGELDDGFYIEDDGPGIPSDVRGDIFEVGYSQSADGTGFGLSIVEQIVTAHGWQIHITDGADDGARFEITGVEFIPEPQEQSDLNREI
jgi:PAS domain S-box-containing protein